MRRSIDGVLLLNKSVGLSSNSALIYAKRLLNAKKAGHTGTLDPLASGLLPLCFGEATKFSQDLLDSDKTYSAILRLGIRTTTNDAEGDVLQVRPVTCDRAAVDAVLTAFRGLIMQVPPMYSALKRDGKPLYKYARAGYTLNRDARAVTIHALECIKCTFDVIASMTIRVTCSKGTYIRTLAEDIGEALGCGAHVTMLHRTGVGRLALHDAITLGELSHVDESRRLDFLQPIDILLSTLSPVELNAEMARRFMHGQQLRLVSNPHINENIRVKVYDADRHRLIGLGRCERGVLFPERVISIPD
ncbi:tRNA pseudouridine(55) synthase TruB [Candidatus Vallotia cooleyia]|uniref:tRNA pseudouridine(55) synthase TruB n=1 Tax=Candidatus Vallotiella adelgis TaxID=1177211 RepID=UPI001D00CE4C|nr:tRNA pseudouridine(55) synthase TruB [Candidatus Vallotia cooleyia]